MKIKSYREIKEQFNKLKGKLAYDTLKYTKIHLGKKSDFPNDRDMAYCTEEKYPQIFISVKIKHLSWNNINAILMHELSHTVLIHKNKNHTEIQTDNFVKKMFNKHIYYDNKDIQTVKRTSKSKRPKYLHK